MEQVHMMKLYGMCSFLMHKYHRNMAGHQRMARLHTMGAATSWCKVDGCKYSVQALV